MVACMTSVESNMAYKSLMGLKMLMYLPIIQAPVRYFWSLSYKHLFFLFVNEKDHPESDFRGETACSMKQRHIVVLIWYKIDPQFLLWTVVIYPPSYARTRPRDCPRYKDLLIVIEGSGNQLKPKTIGLYQMVWHWSLLCVCYLRVTVSSGRVG